MNQVPNNLPLVPHYGAYNNQYYNYYNKYAINQQGAPSHPAQQSQTTAANHDEKPVQSFQSPRVEENSHPNIIGDELPRIIATQERTWEQVHPSGSPQTASPHTTMVQSTTNEDVPADIVASQARALAQIRKQQTTTSRNPSHYNAPSQALVVPFEVPCSCNPSGSDSIHPQRMVMKQQRKAKTAAGVVGGAVVGGLAFGPAFPVGMVLGGTVGGYATNKISKSGERRAQRKWEQHTFQRGTQESPIVLRDGAFV